MLAYQTKSQGSSPRPDIKTKYEKRRFPLSRFLAKNLRVNKIAMKSISKKNLLFEVDFKLQVPPLMYKIKTHNIIGVRNLVNNPGLRVLMINYVCMCIFLNMFKFKINWCLVSIKFFIVHTNFVATVYNLTYITIIACSLIFFAYKGNLQTMTVLFISNASSPKTE